MAAKLTHTFKVTGKDKAKERVIGALEKLQDMPQHKWIPIEEMSEGNRATLTVRQAEWLAARVESAVENARIEFSVIAVEAEAA